MKNDGFVEASSNIRVLEKKVLSNSDFEKLMDTSSVDDLLRILSQHQLYDFSILSKPQDYETILRKGLKDLYDLMKKYTNNNGLIDIAFCKYDFHNVKVFLKSKHLNQNHTHLYSNITELDFSLFENNMSDDLSQNALPPYLLKAMETAEAVFLETNDPQYLDIIVDKLMFEHLIDLCNSFDNHFITKYVQHSIDFYNLKALLRIKDMQKGLRFLSDCLVEGGFIDLKLFLECYDKSKDYIKNKLYFQYFGDVVVKGIEGYDREGNYSLLETLCDNYLIEHIKQSKYIAFGPEVLFAYIVSRENEIRQIRILMTCKINNISMNILRERLRDNYA